MYVRIVTKKSNDNILIGHLEDQEGKVIKGLVGVGQSMEQITEQLELLHDVKLKFDANRKRK